jgi:hypothetical protein
MTPSTYELANLALLLLGMSVNQAGLERNFSDLKIKKTRLRNRLKLPRLEKMAKVRVVKRITITVISPITRLVQTFAHHKRRLDLSKNVE